MADSPHFFIEQVKNLPMVIDEIELFRLDASKPGPFGFNIENNRQHAALRICSQGLCGWSEGIVSYNDPSFQLAPWGSCFSELKGKTIADALAHHSVHRTAWWVNQIEMAETALVDLAGRLLGVPVLDMLLLSGRQAVPGAYCISESEPARAAERARSARQQNLRSHIKLKIYGEVTLDSALIRAVRQVMGARCYIAGDAEGGYFLSPDAPLVHLADNLKTLHQAGLNACEDPAVLSVEEWCALQTRVGLLDLIPDKPLQPVWQSLETIKSGMGRIFNLHPGHMGSLIEAVSMAKRIQDFGTRIMVSDDAFIGPGCTIWQYMAIGLGAVWVEAIEKPEESDVFSQCVRTKSTDKKPDGRFGFVYDEATRTLRPGFGFQVDVALLRKLCSAYCTI